LANKPSDGSRSDAATRPRYQNFASGEIGHALLAFDIRVGNSPAAAVVSLLARCARSPSSHAMSPMSLTAITGPE
jgi:hypothetical protein